MTNVEEPVLCFRLAAKAGFRLRISDFGFLSAFGFRPSGFASLTAVRNHFTPDKHRETRSYGVLAVMAAGMGPVCPWFPLGAFLGWSNSKVTMNVAPSPGLLLAVMSPP